MDYVVGNKYLVGPKISSGSSADVFLGTNVQSNEQVALKMESVKTELPQLKFESKLYRILEGGPGILKVRWYGVQGLYNVMVMDLLGPSLEELKGFCSKKFTCCEEEIARFSLKTVLMLADQLVSTHFQHARISQRTFHGSKPFLLMSVVGDESQPDGSFAHGLLSQITGLQYIHSKGFVHRGVKPENFLMGLGRKSNQVHIVDYGLAKKWRDPKTQEHIPFSQGRKLVGSARFASINNHLGCEQSRRDDLESLGYALVYLINGRLPWQDVKAATREEKHAKIKEMKMDMCAEVLCEGLPPQFAKFVRTTRTLPFEPEPDYEAYRKMFQDCLIEGGFGRDFVFDWSVMYYATAGAPRTFKGSIPPCSLRCGGAPPPPPPELPPPKISRPDPPKPLPKKEQIPQGRLIDSSLTNSINNHKLYFE